MILNGEPDRDALAHELRSVGLRATEQRLAVLGELAGDESHPTAQELFDRVQVDHPSLSFATVYNTLGALTRVGLVRPLSVGGATRFDPNVEPHHHAICDRCGVVRDVPATAGEDPTDVELEHFRADRIEHIYRGLCAACFTREHRG